MKILNVHGSKRGLINPVTNTPIGGLEKTVVDLHNIINEAGYDCWTTSAASDKLVGKFVELNPREKAFIQRILHVINRDNYTHMIVHGANSIAARLTKYGIPFLFIEHIMDKSVNKLYHQRHFSETIPRARSNGSKFYSVSHYAMTNIEKRVAEQKLAEDFRFDGYIKLQYITKELESLSAAPSNGNFITIGRCDKNKDPAGAIPLSNKLKMPLHIYAIMSETNAKEKQYYEEKLSAIKENVFINHPRSDMLVDLASSAIYVSTAAHESAGITALEALSCGVPVMLLTMKDTHASLMFAPDGSDYIKCMPKNKIDTEWVEAMRKLSLADRENIKSITRKFNSKGAVVDGIINVLDIMEPIQYSTIIESSSA
jgi:glycosyltransferase involved in cell wall biosynthesis